MSSNGENRACQLHIHTNKPVEHEASLSVSSLCDQPPWRPRQEDNTREQSDQHRQGGGQHERPPRRRFTSTQCDVDTDTSQHVSSAHKDVSLLTKMELTWHYPVPVEVVPQHYPGHACFVKRAYAPEAAFTCIQTRKSDARRYRGSGHGHAIIHCLSTLLCTTCMCPLYLLRRSQLLGRRWMGWKPPHLHIPRTRTGC